MGRRDTGVGLIVLVISLCIPSRFIVSVLLQNVDTIPEPVDTAVGQELYFEVLELQPIKLSLSFMRTERVSSEEK